MGVIYLLDARKVVHPDLLIDQVVSWSEQDGEEFHQDSQAQPRLSADDLDIVSGLTYVTDVRLSGFLHAPTSCQFWPKWTI